MAGTPTMEFEKPIAELERQIDELKRLAGDNGGLADSLAPLDKPASTTIA